MYPNELATNPFISIDLANPKEDPWADLKTLNPSWKTADEATIKATQNGGKNSTEWTFDVIIQNDFKNPCTVLKEKIIPYGAVTVTNISGGVQLDCGSDTDCGVKLIPKEGYDVNFGYQLSYTLKVTDGMLVSVGSLGLSFKE